MERFFVIPDIHGEMDALLAVTNLIFIKGGFDPSKGDELVQLGDKNDRGRQTYEVFQYFKVLKEKYPDKIHMLLGNHERMMIEAAKGTDNLMYYNGGNQTVASYATMTGCYGKARFMRALCKAGHWDFLAEHLLFLETEDYFFSHAPLPKEKNLIPGFDFRCSEQLLTWSYPGGASEEEWVDKDVVPGKLSVHGHIHGLQVVKKQVMKVNKYGENYMKTETEIVVPGIRQYGNAIFLDTGCGCANEGYLSCLELPAMKVYDSRGKIYLLGDKDDKLRT